MVDLISKTPCTGLLPVTVGNTTLTEISIGNMWSVAPFDGRMDATAAVLKKLGLKLPNLGGMEQKGAAQIIWFGQGQWMISGITDLPPMPAAVTDQSDGWACVRIEGKARDILARLVPVDLRSSDGRVFRTLVGHMSAVLIGRENGVIDVMVMRSMAQTLVHELTSAAKALAARG